MSQLTITAKTGPGSTVTAQVISNLVSIYYDFVNNRVQTLALNGEPQWFDISAATTFTITLTAGVYTLVIS